MPVVVHELLTTEVALDKLGARGITAADTQELLWGRHIVVVNRRGHAERRQPLDRRLLIGSDGSGRSLTLVIESTVEPTAWLLVTGWESTDAERKLIP